MTYEEANKTENIIKELNKRRMCPCGYCTDDKCVPEPLMSDCQEKDFVINKAIEALEKQIPKKPCTKKYLGIVVEYEVAICPHCNDSWNSNEFGGDMNYCSNCGQKLDWGDIEC